MIAAIHAEWTKYRTVRGWVIGMLIAILATLGRVGATLLGLPATFDHVQGLPGTWTGTQVGGGPAGTYPTAPGGYIPAPGGLTVTGSGDISPTVPGEDLAGNISHTLIGTFAGLGTKAAHYGRLRRIAAWQPTVNVEACPRNANESLTAGIPPTAGAGSSVRAIRAAPLPHRPR